MKFKLFKYLFYFFLFLTIIYYSVMFVLVSEYPRFNRFEKYYSLQNWNLPHYEVGDFDGDRKDDLVTPTGCGFFSSAEIDKIPQNQRCISPGQTIVGLKNQDLIGQKYISVKEYNLDSRATGISHSYLFKKQNENWKIFVSVDRLEIFEIRKDGLLQKIDNVPFEFKLDEILYFLSFFALLLVLPFTLLFFFIQPEFLFVIFPIITTFFYFLWKRINPFSMIDKMIE